MKNFWIKHAQVAADATPSDTKRIMNMQIAREQAAFYCKDIWRDLLPDEQIVLIGAVLALCRPDPQHMGEHNDD